MARIRRAKSIVTYWLALCIAATFALFGRSAPTWAEETKQDHNAQVFNEEMYRVARNDYEVGSLKATTTLGKGVESKTFSGNKFIFPPESNLSNRLTSNKETLTPYLSDSTVVDGLNEFIEKRLTIIKAEGPQSIDDVLLFYHMQFTEQLEALNAKIKILEKKLSE